MFILISLQYLKETAKKLKSDLQTIYYAYLNPKVGLLPKLIIMLALAYALNPIDLIQDFIPIIGLLDDLIIVPFLISLSIKLIPAEIMQECRQRAKKESMTLRKNWITAIIFIVIWAFLLYIMTKVILNLIIK
jgi:uncharacterized membrane protein YkvA (DUF1232 family)